MSMREMSDQRASAEMTAPEAAVDAPGLTTEMGGLAAHDEVLARIPDLARDDSGQPRKSRRSDGRLISQKLATRLLVGGVVAIALAAIIPSLVIPGILNKKTEAEGGKPTAPNAPPAPAFDPEMAQNEPPAPSYKPGMSFDFEGLQGPTFTGPGSQGGSYEPSNTPPPWADAQLPELSDPNQQSPVPHVGSRPSETMWDNRGMPITAPQTHTNETMRINNQNVPIPSQYPGDDRPVGPVDPRSVPPGSDAQGPQQWNLPIEPGVARFEGIITKPPLRTTYHGTGSGVY